MANEINIMLNKLYQNRPCFYCGRKYPDTMINIEGWIHHGETFRCLDTKSCKRYRRKK